MSNDFFVRFWGVRGDIPTPGMETVRYGGNTACVEIKVAGQHLIFDGGTGLRVLGQHLKRSSLPIQAHLFFTHTHWDRIQGFPFFAPAFQAGNQLDIYGAIGQNGASIKQRLSDQMLRPNFPVPLQMMQAQLCFHDLTPGTTIRLGDVWVETALLSRFSHAVGYRVVWQGGAVVYATDSELAANQLDPGLLYLAQGADLLIYDASYAESPTASSDSQRLIWQKGRAIAAAAGVKRLCLFHHDPDHDDDVLDQLAAEMQQSPTLAQLAREGDTLRIGAAQLAAESRRLE